MKDQVKTKEQIDFAIDALPVDTCMLVSAREVAGGKIQLEFAEKLQGLNDSGGSILQELNADDARFGNIGARRAWMTASPKMFEQIFGVSLDDLTKIDVQTTSGRNLQIYPLLIENPEIGGSVVHIQVNETLNPPSQWDAENKDRSGKTDGNGNYLYSDGLLIYSKTDVVKGEPTHRVIKHNATHTSPDGLPESVEIADAVKTEKKQDSSVF